uniref:Lymphocyte function-associated antigen 3 n=1 Tax=Catagonus wagneri TaxID=51154 RepID=A0A8C3VRT5_9CETA
MASGSAPGCAVRALGVVCLLLRLDFIGCDSQVIYGALNNNVTLYASSSKPFQEIIWKKGKDKAVEWDEQSDIRAFPPFVDRVHLDTVSGNLTIYKLMASDEDEYQIESPTVKNGNKLILKVVEPLPSPELYCEFTDGNISARCLMLEELSIRHMDLLQYSWNCPPTVSCQVASNPSEVYITKESDLSQDIQCVVSNPLFKTTSSTSLSACVPSDNTRHRYVLFAVLPAVIVALILLKWFLAHRST